MLIVNSTDTGWDVIDDIAGISYNKTYTFLFKEIFFKSNGGILVVESRDKTFRAVYATGLTSNMTSTSLSDFIEKANVVGNTALSGGTSTKNETKKLQLLINLSQSNGVLSRTSDPDSGAGYIEFNYHTFRKIMTTPINNVTFTRTSTGGAWKSATYTRRLFFNYLRNLTATGAIGWHYGWEQHRSSNDAPEALLIDASLGGMTVDYFHPGGGVRVSATGAGWSVAEVAIRNAVEVANFYDWELVAPFVYIHQGESGATGITIDTIAKAEAFVDDWIEIIDAMSVLCGGIEVNAQFCQIFHTTPSIMTQRKLINNAFAARATSLAHVNYVELLTDTDIANQDPNDYTQDDEHWDTQGAIRFGAAASKFALTRFNSSLIVDVPPLPAPPLQEARYYMFNSTSVANQTLNGSAASSWFFYTTKAYVNDAVEGWVLDCGANERVQATILHSYRDGFSWSMRIKLTADYSPGYLFEAGSTAMVARRSALATNDYMGIENSPSADWGVNMADGFWRTLGATFANGALELFLDGASVDTGTVNLYTPGNDLMFFGAARNFNAGARVLMKEIYAINRGTMTAADHLSKHNAMVAAHI